MHSPVNLSGPVLHDTARLSQRYPCIARYGVFGVSTCPIGCHTPAPFSERFPLGAHAKWRCDTPPPLKRGISAILARYPLKAREMGAIPPSAILPQKGIARYGAVSRTGPLRSCLSRVKGRSSPARGYKFGCVCSYMAGVISHQCNDNGHIETNTPKFVPLSLLKRGCANSVMGLEPAENRERAEYGFGEYGFKHRAQ